MRLEAIRRFGFPARDSRSDLLYAGAFFVCYVVVDRLTTAMAGADETAAAGPSLLLASSRANVAPFVLGTAMLVVAVTARPQRWLCRWTDLERGRELRWLSTPLLVLVTWQSSLYQYNYLLGRTHLSDRLLVLVLAAAALRRPVFLLAVVLQSRVVAEQFSLPYGTGAAQGIDDLLLIVLVMVAGAHIMYALTGRADSSPVMLVISAAIATHFFIPGRGKILLNWLANEDLANLASSGYAVGWLGQTDGGLAGTLAGIIATVGLPLRLGALAMELLAVIAATNHRWLRLWLPAVAVFHVVNFLLLGFWFLAWIVLELTLFVLLSRADLREWFGRNLSLGRAAMTTLAVAVFGPLLFHPAGLAWIDSPVAYGYRIEVVGETGTRYNLPLNSFAPFSQELTFSRLQLGSTRRLTGAYGVVVSTERLEQLNGLGDVSEVLALETPTDDSDVEDQAKAERFVRDFVRYANDRADGNNTTAVVLDLVQPLPKFWTGAPRPNYRFQEAITRLEIFRLTSLHVDGDFQHRRQSVLSLDQS